MSGQLSAGIAFMAGLLSFLSPCVLPLVPVYLGYLTGRSVGRSGASSRQQRLAHALLFVLGFGAIFVVLGATAGLLGQVLTRYLDVLAPIGGIILIVLGMNMTGVLKLPWLEMQRGVTTSKPPRPGFATSLLLGALFALGWTPCVGPVLAGVLVLAADAQTVARGSALLGFYALGLGLPFVGVAAGLEVVLPRLQALSRHGRWLSVLSGALLIVLGFLMLTGLYGPLISGLGSLE